MGRRKGPPKRAVCTQVEERIWRAMEQASVDDAGRVTPLTALVNRFLEQGLRAMPNRPDVAKLLEAPE